MRNDQLFVAGLVAAFAIAAAEPAMAQDAATSPPAPTVPNDLPPGPPPAETGWRLDVGAGVLAFPRFPGAKNVRVLPLPAIELHYGDRFFASVREGVGYNLIVSHGLKVGPIVTFVFPRSEGDARQALKGLGNVDFTFEAGGFAHYDFGRVATAQISARKGLNGHNGLAVDGSLDLNAPPLANNRLFFTIGPKISYYDRRYSSAYFGVTPTQASRSAYTVFAPRDGYQVSVGAGATYLLTRRITLSSFATYGRLMGDIARSPIVRGPFGSRDQFTGGANLTYRFNFGG